MPNFFPAKPSSSHGHPAIIENQEKVIPYPVAKILSLCTSGPKLKKELCWNF
jgi:hypothetical protein